jgi:hypothetical protein
MRRRTLLRAAGAAGFAAVAGCTTGYTAPALDGSFERGLGDWTTAAHIGPEEPLSAFEWTTPRLETDRLHLSVGTTVVWETEMTHYIDDVTVELAPR